LGIAAAGMPNQGMSTTTAVEAVTALTCGAILGITWQKMPMTTANRSGTYGKPHDRNGGVSGGLSVEAGRYGSIREWATSRNHRLAAVWPWAAVAVGAVAGIVLARSVPLGMDSATALAFYWTLLSAAMLLTIYGGQRQAIWATGTLAALNAMSFAVTLLMEPGTLTVGLMSLSRIGLALLSALLWNVLSAHFTGGDLVDLQATIESHSQVASEPVRRDGLIPLLAQPVEADAQDFPGE
ncbi:MAG: hypothetical protein M3014_10535, partial [Chloroflexota bacterium]|nr:hypothetical protein [Chloroflexota bacterium]